MGTLRFNNVNKVYLGRVHAVKDLSFTVDDREFLAILGPSGSGKSSTLRLIAGLERVTKGEIYINDRLVTDLSPQERNIAMSFENFGLYPNLCVYDNLAYPLRIRKMSPEKVDKRVREIAEVLGIIDQLNKLPAELSSGQKQRVSIGRALVRRPELTIMDEPLSHVDSGMRVHLRREIKRIHRELGNTTILVTHDQLEAMAMADRILVIHEGVLQQLGTPDELYYHPKNEFVAGFIGTPPMNFLECIIKSEDGHPVLFVNGSKIDVSSTDAKLLERYNKDRLKIGIRPSDILISVNPQPDYGIEANVYIMEPLGEKMIITVTVSSERLKIETDPDVRFDINQRVWLHFKKERIHFFDLDTTMRIN
ncbi:ABC transporter ATP-binding protein [Moorella stamsii]|uniref:ABC transporter ATP-binding protein n=1 Tax=Neomoorella stamsii TaxID=1266720 RepID=UPI0006D56559|nr:MULTISPECIES: ABC transporter ATP-binding protein [Moorella]